MWYSDILFIPFNRHIDQLDNDDLTILGTQNFKHGCLLLLPSLFTIYTLDGGQAMAFRPDDDTKYLVGTDQGC